MWKENFSSRITHLLTHNCRNSTNVNVDLNCLYCMNRRELFLLMKVLIQFLNRWPYCPEIPSIPDWLISVDGRIKPLRRSSPSGRSPGWTTTIKARPLPVAKGCDQLFIFIFEEVLAEGKISGHYIQSPPLFLCCIKIYILFAKLAKGTLTKPEIV